MNVLMRLLSMWRLVVALGCALTMTACASGIVPTRSQLKSVVPALVNCPKPPEAPNGLAGTLLKNHLEVLRLYHLCASEVAGYNKWRESL